jgi:Flp pilus assembly protein TadD
MRYFSRSFGSQSRLRCIVLLLFSALLAFTLAINASAQEGLPDASLQSSHFTLTCFLHDALGRPLSDVFIEIRSAVPPLESTRSLTGPDGSYMFLGLRPGSYDVTVAGGILIQPQRVQIGSGQPTSLTLQLPITVPQAAGRNSDLVSVQQLNVPDKVLATMQRANEAWLRGDVRQSRASVTRTLQLRPYYGPALSLLAILDLHDGRTADAVAGLLQALQYSPDSTRTYFALASAYNSLHQHDDALNVLSVMAKLSPGNWQLHYETGRAYLGQGQFADAAAEFDRGQGASRQEIMVLHLAKAHALLGLKDDAGARAELEIVMSRSPGGPYAAELRELAVALDSDRKKTPVSVGTTARGPDP